MYDIGDVGQETGRTLDIRLQCVLDNCTVVIEQYIELVVEGIHSKPFPFVFNCIFYGTSCKIVKRLLQPPFTRSS